LRLTPRLPNVGRAEFTELPLAAASPFVERHGVERAIAKFFERLARISRCENQLVAQRPLRDLDIFVKIAALLAKNWYSVSRCRLACWVSLRSSSMGTPYRKAE
jgi:hypothetical protein